MVGTQSYFIGDTHFGHAGVVKIRPQFETSRIHDKVILDRINCRVGKYDSLYMLGDIVITPVGWEFLSQIICNNIYLIPGNHCGERTPIEAGYFRKVMGAYTKRLPGTTLGAVFTHLPVHPTCLERWQINVHAHLHEGVIDDPRYVSVSCEQIDYTPISTAAISNILMNRGVDCGIPNE